MGRRPNEGLAVWIADYSSYTRARAIRSPASTLAAYMLQLRRFPRNTPGPLPPVPHNGPRVPSLGEKVPPDFAPICAHACYLGSLVSSGLWSASSSGHATKWSHPIERLEAGDDWLPVLHNYRSRRLLSLVPTPPQFKIVGNHYQGSFAARRKQNMANNSHKPSHCLA